MNPNELTAQQAADWCAVDDGWKHEPMGVHEQYVSPDATLPTFAVLTRTPCGPYRWVKNGVVRMECPYPLTLDGADAAVPTGWKWARYPLRIIAAWTWVGVHEATGRHIDVPDTGDKIGDLFRLAVACRVAAKEQTT